MFKQFISLSRKYYNPTNYLSLYEILLYIHALLFTNTLLLIYQMNEIRISIIFDKTIIDNNGEIILYQRNQ